MNEKLKTALRDAAMGHLLGEWDISDIAMEIAEEHPGAWCDLPRAAITQGLEWAASHARDEDDEDDTLPDRINHMINSGAITHELQRMLDFAKAQMTPPLPG
jgi:hypothetical protein